MMCKIDKDGVRQQQQQRKRNNSLAALIAGLDHIASVQWSTFYLSGRAKLPFNNGARRLSTSALLLIADHKRALYPIFRRIFQIFGDSEAAMKFQSLR
jgi:hypothetical protein